MRKRADDLAILLLRVAAGLIFLPHGYAKVFGDGGAARFAADMPGLGFPAFLGYAAAYAEFFGALMLMAGLLTRLNAFLLACTMFVAAFLIHLRDALYEVQPGASKFFVAMKEMELPLSLLAMSLALLLLGGGRFSLDAMLRLEERLRPRKKTAAEAAALSI